LEFNHEKFAVLSVEGMGIVRSNEGEGVDQSEARSGPAGLGVNSGGE